MKNLKISPIFALVTLIFSSAALAESSGTAPPEGGQPQQQQVQAPPPPQQQCGVNQVTDPRVPPAGSYVVQNANGSSNNIYTTGDKKPYYVDNPCGSANGGGSANLPPQVFVQPNVGTNTGATPAPVVRSR